jgi:hypothetical protein
VEVERLLADERTRWRELGEELGRFGDGELERPGVTPDGWSVRDVMFHIAAWAADCATQLERMRAGTWVRPAEDVERQNREWFQLSRTMDLTEVRAQLEGGRARMVVALAALPEVTADAREWFEESGPLHYESHLRDLRAWGRV